MRACLECIFSAEGTCPAHCTLLLPPPLLGGSVQRRSIAVWFVCFKSILTNLSISLFLSQVAAYNADPLCVSGPTRARTSFQYSKGMDVLDATAHKLTLPLYVEHCKGDVVASWEVSGCRICVCGARMAASGMRLHTSLCCQCDVHSTVRTWQNISAQACRGFCVSN